MRFEILSASGSADFAEQTKLFDRSVGATNVVLDLWWLWLVLFALSLFGFWFAGVRKTVGALDARCKSAFADIDALLMERHDLIPNLVEVTRAYAKQDLEVLDKLLMAQQNAFQTMGEFRLRAETEVGNALNQLVNIAASMPQLASAQEFIELRRELIRIEEKVTAARRFYNLTVEEYDAVRSGVVAGLMARLGGSPTHARFELGERRETIAGAQRVSFS